MFEGLLQRGLNDHICPKTQTVHELPVVHRVNARRSCIKIAFLLNFRHRSHGVANVDGQLANVDKRVLVSRNRIHGIELRDAVTHHHEALVLQIVVLLAILHKREIDHLAIRINTMESDTFIAGSVRKAFFEMSFLRVKKALRRLFYGLIGGRTNIPHFPQMTTP